MVSSGNTWALEWKYPGVFQESGKAPAEVGFVADVLTMWERLEYLVGELDARETAELEEKAGPFGRQVSFPGFDGNNEADLLSIFGIFVEHLGRWQCFKGRVKKMGGS